MKLDEYNRKRHFGETPEPPGEVAGEGAGLPRFVVQMHAASRLHWDFRLELDGVYLSWAVPKGPTLNPMERRLAMRTEDHPLAYGTFEGIIPHGNYGAGTVLLWDEGTYVGRSAEGREDSEAALRRGLEAGHLSFVLSGRRLKGEFALVRSEKDASGKTWFLFKKRDGAASYRAAAASDDEASVVTGRTLAEIAAEAPAKGEVWLPEEGPLPSAAPRTPGEAPAEPAARRAGDSSQRAPRPAPRRAALRSRKASPAPRAAAPESPAAPRASSSSAERLPRTLKPMLPTHAAAAPEDPRGWLFEPRLDGYRAFAEVDAGGGVRLHSRQGLPYERSFPDVIRALESLRRDLVLDGELVVLDDSGHPSPDLLRDRSPTRAGRGVYYVFDLLHADGQSLRDLPLVARKAQLASLVPLLGDAVRLLPDAPDDPDAARALAASLGVSGLTARRADAPYKSGVTPDVLRLPDSAPAAPRVTLTHLDRVFFPDDGYTKGDLVAYYRSVAPLLLPHLADRPQSLHRHPHGITGESFFQKDMTGFLPPWVETVRVASESSGRTIDYLVCQNLETLLYLANLGCIELNPWLSRLPHLTAIDYAVIDLDPDAQTFDEVVRVARTVHDVLTRASITSFVKTSGATGLHIYLPLSSGTSFDRGRALAEAVVAEVERRLPELTTTERTPSRRRGRLYLDALQNRRGQTIAAPYCVRPRPGAPVSTPLLWDEVMPGLDPLKFTIKTLENRLSRVGDLWKNLMETRNDAERCLAALATP